MSEFDGHTMSLRYCGYTEPFDWTFHCAHPKPAISDDPDQAEFEKLPACWQYHDMNAWDEDLEHGHPPDWATIRDETECLVLQWTNNEELEYLWDDGHNIDITQLPIRIKWWFEDEQTFRIRPIEEQEAPDA